MSTKDALLKSRFLLNMKRIGGLVKLLSSHDDLKSETLFGDSEGVRADILRAVVVFLHATFEVVLRSHIRRPNRSLSFYSRADLEKALKLSGVDAKPFRAIFPPLVQLAKRRKRIVHDADLSDGLPNTWTFSDDWQLIMWLMAVAAFYFQLRISLQVADVVECKAYERHRAAMLSHVKFANQVLALPSVPPESQMQALKECGDTLEGIMATLKLKVSDFLPDVS